VTFSFGNLIFVWTIAAAFPVGQRASGKSLSNLAAARTAGKGMLQYGTEYPAGRSVESNRWRSIECTTSLIIGSGCAV